MYRFDAIAKEQKLSDLDRLAFHQAHSQPVMDDLQKWMQEQIEQKKVEPNSGLGEAIQYMLKRWQTLTRFLSVPGARWITTSPNAPSRWRSFTGKLPEL